MAGTKHLGAPKLFGESRLDERPTDAETRVDAGDVKRLTDRVPAALISAAGTLQPPTL